jgi:hypothetical protein
MTYETAPESSSVTVLYEEGLQLPDGFAVQSRCTFRREAGMIFPGKTCAFQTFRMLDRHGANR